MAPTVFLDLDGTLTDPKAGITRSIRHALTALGREAPGEESLTWCIGPPLRESFREMLGGDGALAELALARYRERFAEIGIFENAVIPGIPEALDELAGQGCRLFLATAKPRVYAERIVTHFGFDRWLAGVFGAELDGRLGEKPALLAHALSATGARGGVMVGDRRHDVEGAAANGLRSVGVLWGYGDCDEFGGADRIVAAPAELAAAVAALSERRCET